MCKYMYMERKDQYNHISHIILCIHPLPVSLSMDILDSNLEAIEAPCLGDLYLLHEPCCEVLVHNAITRGEESKYTRDEVFLIRIELLIPVDEGGAEVAQVPLQSRTMLLLSCTSPIPPCA